VLSWTFTAAALLLTIATAALPRVTRPIAVVALSLGSIALLWNAPVLPIAAAVVAVYLLGRILPRLPEGSRGALLAGSIATVVSGMLWFRPAHPPQATLGAASSVIGLSYFSLKFIQHLVDAAAGRARDVGLVEFAGAVFFLPTFASGPIERSNELAEKLGAPLLPWRERVLGLERVVVGLGKKLLLANPLLEFAQDTLRDPASGTRTLLLGAIYAVALGIYLDFAGYSDIAIGVSRCAGIQVRENFDWPYLRRNLHDLWANWHMSLTSWLRDFIFVPLARRLLRRTRRPLATQIAAQIVTMLACGLWHGVAWNFVAWGLYHAAGLNVVSAWRQRRRTIARSVVRDSAATLATFHFFAFGMLIFASDLGTVAALVKRFCRL
jgi:D-alanyl-lipoteichoic acid acyltransferase DltB (MBOAT superfamily)